MLIFLFILFKLHLALLLLAKKLVFMLKNTKFYDVLQKNSFENTDLQCCILKTDLESLRNCTVPLQKEA